MRCLKSAPSAPSCIGIYFSRIPLKVSSYTLGKASWIAFIIAGAKLSLINVPIICLSRPSIASIIAYCSPIAFSINFCMSKTISLIPAKTPSKSYGRSLNLWVNLTISSSSKIMAISWALSNKLSISPNTYDFNSGLHAALIVSITSWFPSSSAILFAIVSIGFPFIPPVEWWSPPSLSPWSLSPPFDCYIFWAILVYSIHCSTISGATLSWVSIAL